MARRAYQFRKGERIRFKADGREGVTVRRVRTYPQWMVKLDSGRITFWWESDCESAAAKSPTASTLQPE